MPNRCFVVLCNSGYDSEVARLRKLQLKPPTLFAAPKDEGMLKEWRKYVPKREGVELTSKDHICEKHFCPEDVDAFDVLILPDGTDLTVERKRKILREGAIPRIFQSLPERFNKPKPKRTAPKQRGSPRKKQKTKKTESLEGTENTNQEQANDLHTHELQEDTVPLPEIDWHQVSLPNQKWAMMLPDARSILFLKLSGIVQVDRFVQISKDYLKPKVHIHNTLLQREINAIKNPNDVENLLKEVDTYRTCPGSGIRDHRGRNCTLILSTLRQLRCKFCQKEKRKINKQRKRKDKRNKKIQKKLRKNTKQKYEFKKRVKTLRQKIGDQAKEMAQIEKARQDSIIDALPEKFKEVMRAVFNASKVKNTHGRRYTLEWVYLCLLLRMRGPGLYKKMVRDEFLPLPSMRTLQRYIKKMNPCYGFQKQTFQILKEKGEHIPIQARHGTLLLDEMSITSRISYNKHSMEVQGLIDREVHLNPGKASAKTDIADHALVVVFQPFQGNCMQVLGAFLGKGAIPGNALEKLIIDATSLLHASGFHVDAVTTDGAPWNRNMWTCFGVKPKKAYVPHPTDPSRKLHFVSDFPHLVKCMKQRILSQKLLKTPDGHVKFEHWEQLLQTEKNLHIKACYKLTHDHLYPHTYQVMNVQMAFQTMEHYKDELKLPEFQDCGPTISFIKRVHFLIKAMNSRDPFDGLRTDPNSESHKSIADFILYLEEWRKLNPRVDGRLTNQTHDGLEVTLKGTLHLISYLTSDLEYKYLMTRRLNQDGLEHLFGKVRQNCGANSCPDAVQFIQVLRLLSIASLTRPPRGSNVKGSDILRSILNLKDLLAEEQKEKKAQLQERLDQILDNGDPDDVLRIEFEHDYNLNNSISEHALRFFSGYVARKSRGSSTATSCEECYRSLTKADNEEFIPDESLIQRKTRGYLLRPSEELYNLLYSMEDRILTVLHSVDMHKDIIFDVLDEFGRACFNEVGCISHKRELTKSVMSFYLSTRLIFACKWYMDNQEQLKAKQRKAKNLVKQSRLN